MLHYYEKNKSSNYGILVEMVIYLEVRCAVTLFHYVVTGTGTEPCQMVEETNSSPPEQECSMKKCQEVYHQHFGETREFVNNRHTVV